MPESAGTSWASSEATRRSMRSNRGRDTGPELALRSVLHRRGLRYRVGVRPEASIRRTADVVFRRARVAVFVDGCFWHSCPEHGSMPATNREFWEAKITGNERRDRETNRLLTAAGWRVLRFWEHEDVDAMADVIEKAVRAGPDQDS